MLITIDGKLYFGKNMLHVEQTRIYVLQLLNFGERGSLQVYC